MPLAQLLAPQIAKKTAEIEAAIGPPEAPQNLGYLQASQPAADRPQLYDSATPGGHMMRMLGALQQSQDPALQAVARGVLTSTMQARGGGIRPIPNAPLATQAAAPHHGNPQMLQVQPGEQIAAAENGTPVYTDAPKSGATRTIALPQGAIGFDDAGRTVDAHGRKLGYLNQDTNIRYADRRYGDVRLDDKDAFAQSALEHMYGPHLKAMQDNRDAEGLPTDKFPAGYFNRVPADERAKIEAGVKELMARGNGTRT